jgi:hypothetical protein
MRRMSPEAADRQAIRRRVRHMYDSFAVDAWEKCFSLIDPTLRERSKLQLSAYADGMQDFKAAYGRVHPWMIKLSLHLDGLPSQRDKRPFAYVYVIWQDQANRFHMFQERWVKDGDRWYTRVAGLVPASKNGNNRLTQRTPR